MPYIQNPAGEIDLIATDEENALFCECKYTEKKFNESQLKDLEDSALCINRPNKYFRIFSKNGVTSGVEKAIKGKDAYFVVTLKELLN